MKPRLPIAWRIVLGLSVALIVIACALLGTMFAKGGLARLTAWYLAQLVPPVLGLLTLVLAIICAAVTKRLAGLPLVTSIVSLAAIAPALLLFVPVTYPASLESTQPAATVRLPADVPLRVAWGGNDRHANYHARFPDQRWAYDLLAEPGAHGSEKLEDYGIYGVPVLAPASGVIAIAHDGEPDAKPGSLSMNFKAPFGNHVAILLPTQTYLIIAHLKPGSILVKTGDTVTEGQEIAAAGNSGNTSEPHIHIHHQRQDPREFPVNFAEGLPLYFRDHDGPPMPTGGIDVVDGKPVLQGSTVRHVGK